MRKQTLFLKSALLFFFISMAGGSAGVFIYDQVRDNDKVVFTVAGDQPVTQFTKFNDDPALPASFSAAAAVATPTVVHVKTSLSGNSADMGGMPEPFRDFFGDDFWGNTGPRQASGSGVILSQDGYIVTNNHVVEGAQQVEVVLSDKRVYEATIVGTDPSTDLAVLKIEEEGLPAIVFGNSDKVKVGEWVLAVGNPFNLTSTVTAGIVSAKGRNINILQDQFAIESFIQTDAAVNPGNSGGALVNARGELIGINTAIASHTGSFSGYSFAVPIEIMKKVVEDIIEFGVVQRGFLGVIIRDVDGKLAKEMSLPVTEGVMVDSLMAEGAAFAAGVKSGDVIIKVNEFPVRNAPELQEHIGRHRPGDKVQLTVIRDAKTMNIEVELKNREGNTEFVQREEKAVFERLGAELENIPAEDLQKLNIEGGVRITDLGPGQLKEFTDVRQGFIITKVNDEKVKSVSDIEKILKNAEGEVVVIGGIYPDQPGTYYYAFSF